MPRRLGGLRLQLAVVISAVSVAVLAVSFFALRKDTGDALRDRIDGELSDQWSEFVAAVHPNSPGMTRAELTRDSRRFLGSQAYHPRSRIFVIQIPGKPTITNEQAVVGR